MHLRANWLGFTVAILCAMRVLGNTAVSPRYVGNLVDLAKNGAQMVATVMPSIADAIADTAVLNSFISYRVEALLQGRLTEKDLEPSTSIPHVELATRMFLGYVKRQYIGCQDGVYTKRNPRIYRGNMLYVFAHAEVVANQSEQQGKRYAFSFQVSFDKPSVWSTNERHPNRYKWVPLENLKLEKYYCEFEWLSDNVAKIVGQQSRIVKIATGVDTADIITCSDVARFSKWDSLEVDIAPLDSALTLEYISKLADSGDVDATAMLGTWCGNGTRVPKDYAKALAMLTKAVSGGSCEAARWLGDAFMNGQPQPDAAKNVVPQNYELAFEYLVKAGQWGDKEAANLSINPIGLLERAAHGGNLQAAVLIGRCYLFGRLVPADLAKAATAYRDASQKLKTSKDVISQDELERLRREVEAFLSIDLKPYGLAENLDPIREHFIGKLPFEIKLPFPKYAKP